MAASHCAWQDAHDKLIECPVIRSAIVKFVMTDQWKYVGKINGCICKRFLVIGLESITKEFDLFKFVLHWHR